jgi:hypothetical protein
VSRLFPDRLLIGFAPTGVSVGEKTLPCGQVSGAEPWHGALAALKTLEITKRCKVTVVLSNHFVRYALVPWSDALSGEAEEQAYIRHHFARIHGERAGAWALRASEAPPGAARLASAVDKALLDAIKGCFPPRGKAKLVSLQPALMAIFNRASGAVPKAGAWLALAEPERACVALHMRGRWRAVQSAKGAWLSLLERTRLNVEGETPDLVLLHGERAAGSEAPGWNVQPVV